MSYLTQMLALTFQNFVSAAVGMAVLIAMIRGFIARRAPTTRQLLARPRPRRRLHPAPAIGDRRRDRADDARASSRPSAPRRRSTGHPGVRADDRPRAGREPDRDQAARHERRRLLQRELGAPVRGRRRRSRNFIEMFSILLDPGGAHLHVRQDGRQRPPGLGDLRGDVGPDGRRARAHRPRRAHRDAGDAGGRRVARPRPNLEGKEVRFGPDESSLWAVATTDASNGSVNSMHDSYQPLGGVAPMFNIAIGEVIWGGVGSGLYGMIFYVIIAVFIGGLMVGRTPEYLGKKIGARAGEARRRSPSSCRSSSSLAFTAVGGGDPAGPGRPAEHGTARVQRDLLRVPVAGEQQRVGVRRLTASGPFYAIAGGHRDARRPVRAAPRRARARGEPRQGAAPCRSPPAPCAPTRRCSSGSSTVVIVIIGALTFLPGLALGPIVEHLSNGRL